MYIDMCYRRTLPVNVLAAQSSLPVCDPHGQVATGDPVRGIHQARILKWVAISYSRGSSGPRDQTWVFHITGTFFIV